MRTSKYYIGIDIGTHESKGVLTDETGAVIALETIPHETVNPRPGWFSHDAEKVWWGDFCILSQKIIRKAGIEPAAVACVGLSALGCDCVPVDREGHALAEAILYGIDSRAEEEIRWIMDYCGADEAERLFGHTPCSSDVAPKILWYKNHMPKVWENAYKFLTASSFLCAKLTGQFVLDPYLAEDFQPLYEPAGAGSGNPGEMIQRGRKEEGEKEALRRNLAGEICRRDQLADLLPATSIAGYVTEQAALETGLRCGTPVLTGTGDSGAEAVSAGLCRPGDLMLQLGSSAYMIYLSDRMIEEPRLWPGTFIIPGTCGICGGTNTAGALTDWLRKNLYRPLSEEEDLDTGIESRFALMEQEASRVPAGAGGLVCLPYWAGERTPVNDPRAAGLFFGFHTGHTRAHMVRAALEGICFSILSNVEILKQHGLPIRRVLAAGGGTKNGLWMQCLADILGQQVEVPEISLGAAYGDALMAQCALRARETAASGEGRSSGTDADSPAVPESRETAAAAEKQAWDELGEKVKTAKIYRPRETEAGPDGRLHSVSDIYRKQYRMYLRLYEANKELMHELDFTAPY